MRFMNDNKAKKTIRVFGTIGTSFNGDQFAKDLASMDGKYDTLDLHINSPGGDVTQGYSIISVILTMKTPINVYVVGIAASMAAVIAICGKNVYMYDYSRLMIHDPYFVGKETEKLTDKEKNALSYFKSSLQTILSRRGKKQKEIGELMTKETWFDAENAKEMGLIDGIIPTSRKKELDKLSPGGVYLLISAEYKNTENINIKNMDLLQQLASILGLENPSEEQVIKAVRDLVESQNEPDVIKEKLNDALSKGVIDQTDYENLMVMGNSSPIAFNSYLDKLNRDYDKMQDKKIKDYFEKNKSKSFYVNTKDKEKLTAFAKKDFDLFVSIMNILPNSTRLSDMIVKADEKGRGLWTLDDYRKKAPNELKNNPGLYERLIDRFNKRNK